MSVRMADLAPPVPERALTPIRIRGADVRSHLHSGVAIELQIDAKFVRGCIHWVDIHMHCMVLSVQAHADPVIITVDNFARQVGQGSARLLESAPLFERALLSMLKSADAIDR